MIYHFMVLGLGDVYLGAPCAIPIDPRHRLNVPKYNPSRNFTPEGAVGLGGQYLCIYPMESPGGYQLVGRTLPIWDKSEAKPWFVGCIVCLFFRFAFCFFAFCYAETNAATFGWLLSQPYSCILFCLCLSFCFVCNWLNE